MKIAERPVIISGANDNRKDRCLKRDESETQKNHTAFKILMKETASRNYESRLLNEMRNLIQKCQTSEELYSIVTQYAAIIFPGDSGILYIHNSAQNFLETVSTWGNPLQDKRVLEPDECCAFQYGHAQEADELHDGLLCRHMEDPMPVPYLCVPLKRNQKVFGILHVQSTSKNVLSESKRLHALDMAEEIALMLSVFKMQDMLHSQIFRDSQTGLLTRKYMEESLELELTRARRYGIPAGVILLQIHNFQHLSDAFGYEACKIIMREVGLFLQKHIRCGDISCR
jgi:GGDEF domain-containing protein